MSREHWSSVQEAGALVGLRFMFGIYRRFGRMPFRVLLYPVILYYFMFRHSARRASLQYLQLMEEAGLLTREKRWLSLSYRHFINFGDSLLDKLAVWQGDISVDDIRFHNHEVFDALARNGKGGLIIGSHLGNLEICRALACKNTGVIFNVLMHTAHATKFNAMLTQAGADAGLNIIEVSDVSPATAIILQQKLDQGEFLVIAGDRTPVSNVKNVSEVDFLGHSCAFPQGPFILAAILRCPVLTMFCLRREDLKKPSYDLYLERFSDRILLPRRARKEALQGHIQSYAGILENHCAKAPLQWYNFYSFWAESAPPVTRPEAVTQ